jgi:hypothetical protein
MLAASIGLVLAGPGSPALGRLRQARVAPAERDMQRAPVVVPLPRCTIGHPSPSTEPIMSASPPRTSLMPGHFLARVGDAMASRVPGAGGVPRRFTCGDGRDKPH